MKTLFKTTAVAAALAFAPAVMAQDMGWYGDVGVGIFNVDEAGVDVSATTIQGHVGYDFNDNFAVEGELAFGIQGDEVNSSDLGITPNVSVDVDVNYVAGIYGVVSTANTDGFEFFGRLGYVTAEVEASASGISAESDANGFAYGLGAKYYFDGSNGVRFDATSIEGDATTFSIGYARKF